MDGFSARLNWILEEMLKNGDVAGVFLTTGEEAVELDQARLVILVAISSRNQLDVDCLFLLGGFGEKPEAKVSEHAVDEAFAFQRAIFAGLGANPQVWDVEAEAAIGQFGSFPRTTEILLDPEDVILWYIGVHPSCASVVEVGGERHVGWLRRSEKK